MLAYAARRTLAIVPVMAVVSLFVFGLLHLAPGDPAAIIAGDQATPDDIARIRVALGLDQPLLQQFVTWLARVLSADLGLSVANNMPVSDLIAQRIGPTLSLVAVTMVLAVAVAIPLGVAAASRVNSWTDRVIMGVAVLGFSVPVFVVGYALAYVFGLELQWLPVQGYTPLSEGLWPWLRHLILPSAALATVYAALIARMTRAAMIDVLQQDYIRADRAKGMNETTILFARALKNAAPPIVTVIGAGIGLLIGGAVVSESVFAIPGLGRLTIDSILRRDYPVIQGVVLLFSVSYVLINLAIDILYAALDPRIRY